MKGPVRFMGTLEFDSLDRRFAAMAAAAFVGLIAVVAWMWLSTPAPGLHAHRTAPLATAEGHYRPLERPGCVRLRARLLNQSSMSANPV